VQNRKRGQKTHKKTLRTKTTQQESVNEYRGAVEKKKKHGSNEIKKLLSERDKGLV